MVGKGLSYLNIISQTIKEFTGFSSLFKFRIPAFPKIDPFY